jgi:hypothetical protein
MNPFGLESWRLVVTALGEIALIALLVVLARENKKRVAAILIAALVVLVSQAVVYDVFFAEHSQRLGWAKRQKYVGVPKETRFAQVIELRSPYLGVERFRAVIVAHFDPQITIQSRGRALGLLGLGAALLDSRRAYIVDLTGVTELDEDVFDELWASRDEIEKRMNDPSPHAFDEYLAALAKKTKSDELLRFAEGR